ncbi:MAG: KH domain-containing protein [Ruminococcaceae bacterium]|nr:KH domain-containing protein [Oscillospiraceae bacterium]
MIKEAIGVAPTIEEAIKMATDSLHAPIDADVKVEIVTFPKKKILGLFGGADAQVKAFYDDGVKEAPVKEVKKEQAPKKKVESKPQAKKETPKKEVKKDAPKKETKKDAPKKEKAPEVDLSGIEAKETPATEYLKSILNGMGFSDVTVTAKETEEDIYFEIVSSEDYGNIIGRRGETLDALQYLTRLFVNRSEDNNKRVTLNVGDYRKRREETLRALAKRQASKVSKYGRSSALEPMNPYERRIIHTAIQEIEGVTSHSVGEGDRRRVVITPEGGDRRGNYRNDRRGSRERRAPYVPETPKEPREKKIDAASSSLYGKIQPKKKVEEATEE